MGNFKTEWERTSETLAETVQKWGRTAHRQIDLLRTKKDRHLKLKELGELTYRLLAIEGRDHIVQDLRVRSLLAELRTLEETIRGLENEVEST